VCRRNLKPGLGVPQLDQQALSRAVLLLPDAKTLPGTAEAQRLPTAATAVYLIGLLSGVKVSLPALLRRDHRENIENHFWPVRSVPLDGRSRQGHKDVAELLLASKAEVNAKNNSGTTPLHIAALLGYKAVAELLLANNAEVNPKNNNGSTPLHWAAKGGHKEVAELLRQHGGQE
jgi:ankyrin repeat protein